MKKLLLGIILTLIIQYSYAYDIQKIRKDYIEAIKSESAANKLYDQLKVIKNPDPLITAYLGSAQAIRAKHAWNPVNKLNYLKEGCKTLDKAVAKNPNQLEIRFLRFSLQHYIPTFLGYSKDLNQDKAKIIELIQKHEIITLQLDKTIMRDMIKFLINSKRCDEEEIAILKEAIA